MVNSLNGLEITDYTIEGQGITHTEDGRAIFVPGAVCGDVIIPKQIKKLKNISIAEKYDILSPSIDRISNDCDCFKQCGGCCFRNISYESELKFKAKRVKDSLERIGNIYTDILPITGSDSPNFYRNKVQLPFTTKNGHIKTGFFSRNSHNVIACSSCKLQPEIFTNIAKTVCDFADNNHLDTYNENTGKGLLRHLFMRIAPNTGEILVCIVINGHSLQNSNELVNLLTSSYKNIKSIQLNINTKKTNVVMGEKNIILFGESYIEDILCGLKFHISTLSFYQVNSPQAEKLYNKAAEFAQIDNQNLVDLYCGIGTIGLSMASKAKKITGIEIIPDAIKDAKHNAEINNISNANFICGDASSIKDTNTPCDVLIVDPPRKGCSNELLKTVTTEILPKSIVYISCNPATLARDAKFLTENGYTCEKVAPYDLFPRTTHVETVVLMSRVEKQ